MTNEPRQATLHRALKQDPFEACDRLLVDFLQSSLEEDNPCILAAAALCLAVTREGHAYLDLQGFESPEALTENADWTWPTLSEWKTIAASSPSIGSPEEQTPLVLDGESALYLRKYFEYESELARSVVTMAESSSKPKPNSTPSDDLQKQAVEAALANRFYIISGGPGTGKTTTVLDYLIKALERHSGDRELRIAAVAPTGKAAIRLAESIRKGIDRFDLDDARRERLLSVPCLTIHRLLQGLPFRIDFKRDRNNPIAFDILIVDESSMVDLPLMQRLFDAIPVACSVVLLGDRNQLASVEVGSIFGDLASSTASPESPLRGKSTMLEKTYRFSEDSSIFRICESCKTGDGVAFQELLQTPRDDFAFHAIQAATRQDFEPIVKSIERAFNLRLQSQSPAEALRSLESFIALAPFNRGPFGASSLNRLVDTRIRQSLNIETDAYYAGQPIIVLENNYDLELFNGDIGVLWPDPDSGELFAWFDDPAGGIKSTRSHWLPKHSAAYCLTIHKSQGSEFDEVLGVFSPEDNDFLTRELVYTCASRARKRLKLYGSETALANAISRSVDRATRLEQRILEKASS